MNSTIGQALRAYVKDDQSNWPSILPGILMVYHMAPAMRSTEFSPYFLVFGHEMLNLGANVNLAGVIIVGCR